MIRWDYLTAKFDGDMVSWDDGGETRKLTLESGLRLFGSQGWELVTIMDRHAFGLTARQTLIFKRPTEG